MTRTVFVDAVDNGGQPVLNLTAEDFQVTENGVKRDVTRAALGNAPMRIVLMVDSSTPVAPMINNFRTALTRSSTSCRKSKKWCSCRQAGRSGFARRPDSRDRLRAEMGASRPKAAPTRSSTPCSKPTSVS